jgi:cyclin G-associated kinase
MQKFTTTIYRAPEMCDLYSFGQQMDTKVDIWALGCIFYSLLYLKSPFATGSNVQIISGKYTIPERPRYSRPVHELLQSMLTVNPAKRANIAEVIQRLSGLLVANNISTSVLPRIRPAAPTSAAPTAPPKDSPTSLAASASASASEHYSPPQLRKTNSDPFPTPEPWDADFGVSSSQCCIMIM